MKIRCLSRNTLKIIALIAMILDHIGEVFSLPYSFQLFQEDSLIWTVLRLRIGRIAFPIFCVLFLEGFFYVKAERRLFHVLRLLVFAVISEFAFDMALSATWLPHDGWLLEWSHQNVMFSWLMGFLLLWLLDTIDGMTEYFSVEVIWMVQCIFIFIFALAAWFFRVDYRMACMLGLGIGYLLKRAFENIEDFILCTIVCCFVVLFYGMRFGWCFLAVVLFLFYDKSIRGLRMKYLFYVGYPLHLFCLACIAYLLQ